MTMTTNKSMYVLALLLGSAVLIAGVFLLPDTEPKILPGLLMVVGAYGIRWALYVYFLSKYQRQM